MQTDRELRSHSNLVKRPLSSFIKGPAEKQYHVSVAIIITFTWCDFFLGREMICCDSPMPEVPGLEPGWVQLARSPPAESGRTHHSNSLTPCKVQKEGSAPLVFVQVTWRSPSKAVQARNRRLLEAMGAACASQERHGCTGCLVKLIITALTLHKVSVVVNSSVVIS